MSRTDGAQMKLPFREIVRLTGKEKWTEACRVCHCHARSRSPGAVPSVRRYLLFRQSAPLLIIPCTTASSPKYDPTIRSVKLSGHWEQEEKAVQCTWNYVRNRLQVIPVMRNSHHAASVPLTFNRGSRLKRGGRAS